MGFDALHTMLGGGGVAAYAANPYEVKEYDLSVAGGGNTGDLPCVWVSKTDNDYHWDECANHKTAGSYWGTVHAAGGVRGSKVAHNKSVPAVVDCNSTIPVPIRTCLSGCGWKYADPAFKRSCVSSVGWATDEISGYHTTYCTVCGGHLIGVNCKTASGIDLRSCNSPTGTCATCGKTILAKGHAGNFILLGANIICNVCGLSVGTGTVTPVQRTNGVTVADFNCTVNSITMQPVAYSTGTCYAVSGTTFSLENLTFTNGNRTVTGRLRSTATSTSLINYDVHTWIEVPGQIGNLHIGTDARYDWTAPTYNTHTLTPPISGTTWSTQRDIIATFSDTGAIEDYLDIGLFNSSGVQLVAYGAAVNNRNGTFTRTFRLMVDAPSTGAEFILRARDRHNQIGEKRITLSYTDAVAPSGVTVTGYSATWTKTKTLRVTANELGSGNVEMAFEDTSDYCLAVKSGTSYYRDFIFKGTVATPVVKKFLVRDALGNMVTHSYTIGYLDNTLPTMTLSQSPDTTGSVWYKGDVIITVNLSDEHSGLANLTVPTGCTPVGNIALGGAKTVSRSFAVREPGNYTFMITDVAGNQVTKTINVIKVDNVNPNLLTA